MPLRTRSPNPLPEVDSRWIAHNRDGAIVIIDGVSFDETRREARIKYHVEATGYVGATWHRTFRQRCAFSPAGAPPKAPCETIPEPTTDLRAPVQGPPCAECGAPCPRQANGTWRKTCSAPCFKKAITRGKARETAPVAPRAPQLALPLTPPPAVHGPSCRVCGAPCQKRKSGGGWRSTCSPKCLQGYRSGMMAKGSAIQAAARISARGPRPIAPLIERAVERSSKGKSTQVSVRLAASDVAEVDALAGRLSRPGMTVYRADALRIALLSGLAGLRNPAQAPPPPRPLSHLRSVM